MAKNYEKILQNGGIYKWKDKFYLHNKRFLSTYITTNEPVIYEVLQSITNP